MDRIERLLKCSETENPKRFSAKQLQAFTSEYSKSLGSGGSGEVYKGKLQNGVKIAVKVLKGGILSDNIKDHFKAEVSILGKLHHKNVVELYGFCFEHSVKALVYEFMENGSLEKNLYGNQYIEWRTLWKIATGVACGLSYLHKDCQPTVIHYDIKPSNILLDSKFSPKVGDFGLAKLLNPDQNTHITESGFRGTPVYGAPELLQPYSPVTNKCDVYSFGITLFDIIGRRRHVLGEGPEWFPRHVWKRFEEKREAVVLRDCGVQEKDSKQAKRMLLVALLCVQFMPDNRPSMSHVLRLLEGGEHIEMPPNPFLYLGSSSSKENGIHGACQMQPVLTGPWGGPEGDSWDDGIYAGVKQILLFREGNEIHGIQIQYCGKNGESIWSKPHGSADSHTLLNIVKFDYPSEILTRITGYYDSGYCSMPSRVPGFSIVTRLRSLCFFINKKKHGPYGDEVGTYFTSWMDGKVVGFHGRSSGFLDAIGLHMDYSCVS